MTSVHAFISTFSDDLRERERERERERGREREREKEREREREREREKERERSSCGWIKIEKMRVGREEAQEKHVFLCCHDFGVGRGRDLKGRSMGSGWIGWSLGGRVWIFTCSRGRSSFWCTPFWTQSGVTKEDNNISRLLSEVARKRVKNY
jgi:hypothetical protein